MDRRTLLKSAAAIPAAAMVPALSSVASAIEPAAPVTPAQLRPYANYVWQWFVSHDGETYYEAFPTKEEAIQYAQQCEYSLIAECIQQDFDLSVDAYSILERIDDNNMELIGEGEGIQCSSAQASDLEKMIQKAIEAWVVKHNIDLTAWSFGGVRNETDVPDLSTVTSQQHSAQGE